MGRIVGALELGRDVGKSVSFGRGVGYGVIGDCVGNIVSTDCCAGSGIVSTGCGAGSGLFGEALQAVPLKQDSPEGHPGGKSKK